METQKVSVKYRQGSSSINQLIENIRQLADELDKPRREFQEKQQEEETRVEKIESLTRDVRKMQEELINLPSLVDIKPQLHRLSIDMGEIDVKIRHLQVNRHKYFMYIILTIL